MLELPTWKVLTHRLGDIFYGAQCKMKMWDPFFKNYEEFQDSDSRAPNQASPGPLRPQAALPSGAGSLRGDLRMLSSVQSTQEWMCGGKRRGKEERLGTAWGMNACGHWVETVVPQQGTDVKQQWIQNVCRQLDGPGFGRVFATKQRYLTLFL